MLEYSTEAELVGTSILQLAQPEDRSRMQTELGLTFETGVMRNAEYNLCRKSGGLVPVALALRLRRIPKATSPMLALLWDNTAGGFLNGCCARAEFNRRITSSAGWLRMVDPTADY
jgi:hypothetical protein